MDTDRFWSVIESARADGDEALFYEETIRRLPRLMA